MNKPTIELQPLNYKVENQWQRDRLSEWDDIWWTENQATGGNMAVFGMVNHSYSFLQYIV